MANFYDLPTHSLPFPLYPGLQRQMWPWPNNVREQIACSWHGLAKHGSESVKIAKSY